jgi:ketosteroid isomerase-like protein
MSAANIELARSVFDAYNRGDLDAVLAMSHPELEFRTSGIFPGLKPVYRGHSGLRKFWRDFYEMWESIANDVEDLRAAGDQVVALFTYRAHGRDGVEVRRQGASVVTIRNGLLVRNVTYPSWQEALRAAGLDD